MSRNRDRQDTPGAKLPNLQPIDWAKIDQRAPTLLRDSGLSAHAIGVAEEQGWAALEKLLKEHEEEIESPLPAAEQVIMVWTSAEWSALDHVFCNSGSERAPYGQEGYSTDWRKDWYTYARGASDYDFGHQQAKIWGYYRRVRITTDHELADGRKEVRTVLLYKSNSHLDSSPYLPGLQTNVSNVLEDTGARRIYSTGTAGGSRPDQQLGDAVVTNAAHIELTLGDNSVADYNNETFTCAESFPGSDLMSAIEGHLMVDLGGIVHKDSSGNSPDNTLTLESLFDSAAAAAREKLEEELEKASSSTDRKAIQGQLDVLAELHLDDMLNYALDPAGLHGAQVKLLQNVPLLTTDFYYIGQGSRDYGYAFLEMDDAVIAHQAEAAGVQYAFIRNISDPIVPSKSDEGQSVPYVMRKEWSGNIYSNYGIYTSVNSALCAWAAIAGDEAALTPAYNPRRQKEPLNFKEPLEISLVFNVRACGTCDLFWPAFPEDQPYGPYTAYNTSLDALPDKVASDLKTARPEPWKGRSVAPSFPNPEIMDGCRKAPIMTIGINPNLTAFLPGRTGAAWAYPKFETDDGGNAYEKYAKYYRYRSVNQESLAFSVAEKHILPEGRIVAEEDGKVVEANRYSSSPSWEIKVQYGDDRKNTRWYQLNDTLGEPPYVLLFDHYGDGARFEKGDVIAGKIHVPAGEDHLIYPKRQTYYGQFVPALNDFQAFLRKKSGDSSIDLAMGEDVCQLDMVACASPHWRPSFLGGSERSESTVINNCVSINAWAIKQMVQTRPAVLFLVGESSWDMFRDSFSALLSRQIFADGSPPDGPFSLFSVTRDSSDPLWFEFGCTIGEISYSLKTRIVVTPHFSFSDNFAMQYRVSPADWKKIQERQPEVADYLTERRQNDGNVQYGKPASPDDYAQFILADGKKKTVDAAIGALPGGADALQVLQAGYTNAHAGMAQVLEDMYNDGQLGLSSDAEGHYLSRTEGACSFCDNSFWKFPQGCPYGKPEETAPPPGFLDAVAAALIARARPTVDNPNAPSV